MQKVNQNDKNLGQPYAKLNAKKRQSIGGSTEFVSNKMKTMSPSQKESMRDEPGVSLGVPVSGQSSGQELKITFVGDQALMK